MIDELNESIYEQKKVQEINELLLSDTVLSENPTIDVKIDELPEPRKLPKQKKSKTQSMNLLSSIAIITTIGTVGVTAIADENINIDVQLEELYMADSFITCHVSVSDFESKSLTLRLVNDFTHRSIPIESEGVEASFEELIPGMTYWLEVTMATTLSDSKTIFSQKMKLYTTEEYLTPRFLDAYSYLYEGNLHFSLYYDDIMERLYNFSAYVVDGEGHQSHCVWTGSGYTEQTIPIAGTELIGPTATLIVECFQVNENPEVEASKIEFCRIQVNI